MRYQHVCLESLGYTLPAEAVTSAELEQRLAPTYQRLRLPSGRLELMSGIAERRFFPAGAPPSRWSIESGRRALEAAGINGSHVGALVHGSVCRDFLEPATACSVHHALGLPAECMVYDVSNACLGILTGVIQIANMIELGQIRAGLVVGTECGRALVENTIERLNGDASIDRREVKQFFASLTIGSASAAILLCDRELSRTQNRLVAATTLANTSQHQLCQSDGLASFMRTDSESLMAGGVETGARTFERFLDDAGWTRDAVDKTACHQVGSAHRRLLFESLQLDEARDYATLEWLGNTGAAALPITLALAAEDKWFARGDRVALMGIGSGINCQMIGLDWQKSRVAGNSLDAGRSQRAAVVLPTVGAIRTTAQKTRSR